MFINVSPDFEHASVGEHGYDWEMKLYYTNNFIHNDCNVVGEMRTELPIVNVGARSGNFHFVRSSSPGCMLGSVDACSIK